jgi:micrococcal nuclease
VGNVIVELDVQERDKYGRLLGYLFTEDGRLMNLEMVRDGYAVLFTFPPNVRYAHKMREAQEYARREGLGIWAKDGLRETPGEYRKRHPRH